MLKKIKQFLKGEVKTEEIATPSLEVDSTGKATSSDVHIAVAVLLVHIASIDEDVVKEEAEAICSLIEYNLGVPTEEIPALVEMAVVARRSKETTDDFTDILNVHFSTDQKIRLLAMIWKLVHADQKIERLEERMIIKIRNSLKLTFEQGQKARKMAEQNKV